MIKRLASCVREFKRDSILAPLCVTMEVVMEVVIPLLMARLIDNGINAGNMPYLIKMGIFLALSAGISMLFGALSGRFAARASAGFARNLRHDLYGKVQTFSFANIDKFSSAGIVTRLTTDVTNLQNAYQMIIRVAVRAPVMLLFSLGMAFSISARLSLVFLCVIPVLGLGLFLLARKAHPIFERVFLTYDKLNNVVQENLRGIRVVKSFVREDHEIEKFGKVSDTIYRDFSRAEKTVACNMPLMQLCLYTCMLLISWIGAELLDEDSSLQNPAAPITHVQDGAVAFEGVSFSYSSDMEKLCLRDVSFSIPSGHTVGILGGTGSSKSTLVQLIPRLYDATSGRVLVGGVDVRAYDMESLRENVAMVLQKNELFSGTIRENLLWGNENATDEELVWACRLAQADDFIRAFPDGYDTHIEQGGANVSGGQKQRLCIARALLKRPKILILDDSTSAVDTRTDALIRQAFRSELPDTTKFIIAQRVSSIQDADTILVLDNGAINGIGTHEQLLQTNRIYQEVFTSQTTGEQMHA